MGVFSNELAAFEQAFNTTKISDQAEKKQWTPPFPVDENSEALITAAHMTRPPWQNDDGVYLRVELTHEMRDQSVDVYYPMTAKSDGQRSFVKSQLKKLGYDLDKPENTLAGLEQWAPENLVGCHVSIYTKQREHNGRTRYNYYINEITNIPDTKPDMDDDIPF